MQGFRTLLNGELGDPLSRQRWGVVQIKRIHEYKRQYLNMLSVLWRYKQLKKMTPEERASTVPRVVVVGGKAASAYDMAKRIIRLVTAIGEKVRNPT